MNRRAALLLVAFAPCLRAQFGGLSSTADGGSLYFSSTLRLKGAPPLLNGKIYLATQDIVTLYRSHERAAAPSGSPPCTSGGFSDYVSAETASNGMVALLYLGVPSGGCSFPPNTLVTQIATPSGNTTIPGIARLSANGRYVLIFLASAARPASGFSLSFLDLITGTQTPVSITPPAFPEYASFPATGGRVVANDGTALLRITDGLTKNRGYIVKPGAEPQPFPVADGLPLIIDAAATKVLYQRSRDLYLLDLRSLASTLLIPAAQSAFAFRMNDDARRLLFIADGQLHLLDTAAVTDRTLTADTAQITDAAISGDGKVAYAVTGRGRLLKINVDDASATEIIGHTPYLQPFNGSVIPGFTTQIFGSGLSDSVITGTVPLQPFLGNVTMWIGERKVPLIRLAPDSVTFLVPWDIQPAGGSIRMLAEAPGEHTPFYYPEAEATLFGGIAAGVIARQDWSQTYVGPINTGEIIHVFATGFGAVSPEVPAGAAAPASEPFSRITQPFTCSNAEILYAGLAPFAVERIYQIDIRIGPTTGYQKFLCSLGGGVEFNFLTLDIVP